MPHPGTFTPRKDSVPIVQDVVWGPGPVWADEEILARSWWSMPRPGPFTPTKDSVPIVQDVVWAPGPVWAGEEILSPIGI